MPSNVRYFAYLNYISLFLGVLDSALAFHRSLEIAAKLGGAVTIITSTLVLIAFLLSMVLLAAYRRKNWARWVLLVMFVFGLLSYLAAPASHLWHMPTVAAGEVAQSLLQAVALYLVFTGNAKDWFRKPQPTA